MYWIRHAACVLAVITATACGGGSSNDGDATDALAPPPPDLSYDQAPGDRRVWLTVQDLESRAYLRPSLLHNGHFMPVGRTQPALHAFSGTLRIANGTMGTTGPVSFEGLRMDLFPDVPLRFISHAGHLVPLQRDRRFNASDGSYWGLILSPGRVWSEPGDGNRSRASFPFILIHTHRNQAHNGIATFLYDDDSVSNIRIQVTQETASWAQNDYWGHFQASYTPEVFGEDAVLRADYDDELRDRVPHADWSYLERIHGSPLEDFDFPVPYAGVSASAVFWNRTLYVHGCETRSGPYPYCDRMRHGAFSVTKSALAAVAMLRLAEKFGVGVFDERIEDYVTVTAGHGGWTGVTFGNVLDMATGIGDLDPDFQSDNVFADENKPKADDFQNQDSAADKLDIAFSYDDYPWGPGMKVRYASPQTFVLAAAMDAYLKAREGPGASILDMLETEVFEPIGIRHLPLIRTIEAGGAPGLPVLFAGWYPTLEDTARVADLLQDNGRHEGRQLLHPEMTAQLLYRQSESGLPAPFWFNDIESTRYLGSFWSWASVGRTRCTARTAVMSGFGGNIVALLPNGASAFRFADNNNYSPFRLVEIAGQLAPVCH